MSSLAEIGRDYNRTGASLKCCCKPQPYPYELEGSAAKTASDAAVLRDAFRKHNYAIRVKSARNKPQSLLLSTSIDKPQCIPPDLINRLPTEILDQILSEVYNSTEASSNICSCSRPGTPYKAVKSRSLMHRIVDTFAIRLTCSRWHSWTLKFILSGPAGEGEYIEIDVSDLDALSKKMQLSVGGVGKRLVRDFPFLAQSGITLYLGNPGEVSNLVNVAEMLIQEKSLGGDDYRVFRGISFWDSPYTFKEVSRQTPWNGDSLLLLDIMSHFSAMEVPTCVQFPATILATLPQGLWGPVLAGLLCYADKLSLREFLVINHGVTSSSPRAVNGDIVDLLQIPKGNLPTFSEHFQEGPSPAELEKYCGELHSGVFLGSDKYWENIRHLSLNLKHDPQAATQNWRIDDTFLKKFSCCNLKNLVSVQVDGGLASSLTMDGLLSFLRPSYRTLKKLIFKPAVGDPGAKAGHHCRVLSSLSFEKTFPQLETLELHVPCCPDIFSSDDHQLWRSALKRNWKFEVQRSRGVFMGFCQDWVRREGRSWLPRNLTTSLFDTWEWNAGSLKFIFESARAARKGLFSPEMEEAERMQLELEEITPMAYEALWLTHESMVMAEELGITQDQAAGIEDMKIVRQQLGEMEDALANKRKEISGRWQLEIHMKNVRIDSKCIAE